MIFYEKHLLLLFARPYQDTPMKDHIIDIVSWSWFGGR
jgi:hypothetical protein